jgi:hypothetical protein
MADSNDSNSPVSSASATQQRPVLGKTMPRHCAEHHPGRDFANYLREYAREKPEVAALWCFGIGFVLGWKLKFW